MVFLTDVSGQNIGFVQKDSSTLSMGPIGCSETSAINNHYLMRNNPEECGSQCPAHGCMIIQWQRDLHLRDLRIP